MKQLRDSIHDLVVQTATRLPDDVREALGRVRKREHRGSPVSLAVEAIARNPSASGDIRGNLLLGLVLIESLVIYVLLISLILFFLKPFGG